jgi:predicted outer membrane repeat protein
MNRRVFTTGCVFLQICFLFMSASSGAILYVDGNAVGAAEGSSWADGFSCLQDALAVVTEGDEIRVAQGVYRPDQGAGVNLGDRGAAFHIVNGIILRGGYAGVGATDPNARSFQLYKTVLSGDCNADDSDVEDAGALEGLSTRADNSLHVIVVEQVGFCVLDGFIVRGGHAADGGGGLQVMGSSPTLWNCTFSQNWSQKGGAVFIGAVLPPGGRWKIPSAPGIHNCEFSLNASGSYGGALYTEESSLLLTDCQFAANTSSRGGAICSDHTQMSLSRCVFRENWAVDGGALYHVDGDLEMTACTFEANSAWVPEPAYHGDGEGGAMFIRISDANQAVATDCLFEGNRAVTGGVTCGNPTAFRGCRFAGNVASGDAGVLESHGGLGGGALTCENCLFDGNRAFDGYGVIVLSFGTVRLTNCTLVGNRSAYAGAFNVYGGHGGPMPNVFANCIIWGDDHGFSPGKWWLAGTSVTYCDIQGGYSGQGNIDSDPLFADLGGWDTKGTVRDLTDDVWIAGDYHLRSPGGRWDAVSTSWVQEDGSSPCIDAGDPNSPVGEEPEPNGRRINMGVYGGTGEASLSYIGK